MRIAFLFSGQGAQYSGMMKDISEHSSEAKKVFDIADQALCRSISNLCFYGDQELLNLTHNTQPCVLAADLAAYEALTSEGIKADAVAGFSLGEYAALVAAGVIKIYDAFMLIQKRADYMQDAVAVGQGTMAAIMRQTPADVQALCNEIDGYVVPANYNCPGQIVVSGETKAIDQLCEIAKERKIKAIKVPVSAPFHCEMMNPAADRLAETLTQTAFYAPIMPVYMNVDAQIEKDPAAIRRKLVLQAKSPVYWENILRNMRVAGIDTFVELGPGKTLTSFVKKTFNEDETVRYFNVTNVDTLNETVEALKG